MLGLVTPPTINPHYTTNKVKVLAQTGTRKHPLLPNVPTFLELRLADAVVEVWHGVMAPSGLPPNIREKAEQGIGVGVEGPGGSDRLNKMG